MDISDEVTKKEKNILFRCWAKTPKPIKKTINIFGILSIGALSTPFWNYVLQPFLDFLNNSFFSIMTNASKTMELMIYTRIARSTILETIAEIKFLLFLEFLGVGFLILVIPIIINLAAKSIKNKKQDENSNTINKIDFMLSKISVISRILMVIPFVIVLFSTIQDVFVAQKQDDFYYRMSVCEPYLKDKEFKLLRSNFLLLNSKKEYNVIIDKLNKVIKENNLKIPTSKF